jgi:hypothetical protein
LITTLQENWRCWLNLDCAEMAGGKNEKRKCTCVVSYHDISLLTTIFWQTLLGSYSVSGRFPHFWLRTRVEMYVFLHCHTHTLDYYFFS